MNNKIKKLLLLPSLLLANAYLLTGVAQPSNIREEITTVKETIHIEKTVNISETVSANGQKNDLNYFFILSFFAIYLVALSFLIVKKEKKNNLSLTTNFQFQLKIKSQEMVFNIIKSFKKILHPNYYSLYFYSF